MKPIKPIQLMKLIQPVNQNETDDRKYRITVDQKEDYLVVKAIIENLYSRNDKYIKIEEIKSFLDTHPEIYSFNADIIRNEGLLNSIREDKIITLP